MANIDDVINTNDTVQYFNPGESTRKKLIPKQVYYSYIKEVSIKEVPVKNRYRAKVFNLTLELAEENKKTTFYDNGAEIKGEIYIGREVRTCGIFLFLNPSEGDDWEGNYEWKAEDMLRLTSKLTDVPSCHKCETEELGIHD